MPSTENRLNNYEFKFESVAILVYIYIYINKVGNGTGKTDFSCTPDKYNPSLVFSGDRKIPTRGSTVPVGNEACRVSTGTVGPRAGIFLEPLNTSDRFFFSYTTTVRYSTV